MKADFLKSQKIIHWIMAIIIMLDLNIAQKFGGEMDILDRLESRIDHTSVGPVSYTHLTLPTKA